MLIYFLIKGWLSLNLILWIYLLNLKSFLLLNYFLNENSLICFYFEQLVFSLTTLLTYLRSLFSNVPFFLLSNPHLSKVYYTHPVTKEIYLLKTLFFKLINWTAFVSINFSFLLFILLLTFLLFALFSFLQYNNYSLFTHQVLFQIFFLLQRFYVKKNQSKENLK